MATRCYSQKLFTATIDGRDYTFGCHTTDTRNGFCHTCWCSELEGTSKAATTKVSYYNRTWERFDYETVLRRAIEKFPKSIAKELHEQLIERKAKEEEDKANAFVERFKTLHDGLTDRQKEVLAQTPPMQTQDDADRMMGIMGVMNVFNQLEGTRA